MLLKRQLDRFFRPRKQAQAKAPGTDVEGLQQVIALAKAAIAVTLHDVVESVAPTPTYELVEEGMDKATWYEQRLVLTQERLSAIANALSSGQEVDLTKDLWSPAPSEEEVIVKRLLATRTYAITREQRMLLLWIVTHLDEGAIEGTWPKERCRYCQGSSGPPARKPEFSHLSTCFIPYVKKLRELVYLRKEGDK